MEICFLLFIFAVSQMRKRDFLKCAAEESGAAWKRKSGLSVIDLLNVFDSPGGGVFCRERKIKAKVYIPVLKNWLIERWIMHL